MGIRTWLLALGCIVMSTALCAAFEVRLDPDRCAQRTDGSQLFDVYYTVSGLAEGDSLQIYLNAITAAAETIPCPSLTGDFPWVHGSGEKQMLWDIGRDLPGRDFTVSPLRISLTASVAGWYPNLSCFRPILSCNWATNILLAEDNTIWSWGHNSCGDLGDNSTMERHAPVHVVGSDGTSYLGRVVALADGEHFAMALLNDGTVWTWGSNASGQLGDNTHVGRSFPARVHGVGDSGYLGDIVAISAGNEHALALDASGLVWAWGDNLYGQLGDWTSYESDTPVRVVGHEGTGYLANVIAITAGSFHSLAILADSTLWAWGSNYSGQLGDGTRIDRNSPVQALGPSGHGFLTNVTGIAAGKEHTIASVGGYVLSWGDNDHGQLGTGSDRPTSRDVPDFVVGPGGVGFLTEVATVSTGFDHNMVIKTDGSLWTWGPNAHGHLGDGTVIDRASPVQVVGPGGVGFLTDVIAVDGGDGHTVAVLSDLSTWSWGNNEYGQLGDGTVFEQYTPVRVLTLW